MQDKPLNRPSLNYEDNDDEIVLNKLQEIVDLLTNDDDIDDIGLKSKSTEYLIDVIDLLNIHDEIYGNYSDDYLKKRINALYDKIFKKRRY